MYFLHTVTKKPHKNPIFGRYGKTKQIRIPSKFILKDEKYMYNYFFFFFFGICTWLFLCLKPIRLLTLKKEKTWVKTGLKTKLNGTNTRNCLFVFITKEQIKNTCLK